MKSVVKASMRYRIERNSMTGIPTDYMIYNNVILVSLVWHVQRRRCRNYYGGKISHYHPPEI